MTPMPSERDKESGSKETSIRVVQIIVLGLIMGVVILCGVMLAVGPSEPTSQRILTYCAVGLAPVMLALHFVVPGAIVTGVRQQISSEEWKEMDFADRFECLYPVYQMTRIVGWAMLESAAFLASIAYLVEGQIWVFGIAALMIVVMALSFPTNSRVERWVENQGELISRNKYSPTTA